MHRPFFVIVCSFGLWSFIAFNATAATVLPGAGEFQPFQNEYAAAIVMVPHTHQILFSFKPDQKRTAASLTKLSNALVWARQGTLPLNRVVSMKKQDEVGGGRLRLSVGSRLTFRDLWYSAIAASANNAAMALARASGLSQSTYVARMNQEAKRAGATHSKFVEPSGMDPKNFTTARDMALIAEAAFDNQNIRLATQAGTYSFSVISSGEKKTISNTNKLLTSDPNVWVTGGKTGYLEESMYNFVVKLQPIELDGTHDSRKEVIVVVLGAPNKEGSFASAKRLAQWAWDNHKF